MSSYHLRHNASAIMREWGLRAGLLTRSAQGSGKWPAFLTATPDKPSECVTLFDATPAIGNRTNGDDSETAIRHGIQIRVRSESYANSYAQALAIRTAVEGINNVDVPYETELYRIQCVSIVSHFPMGRDDNQRAEQSINFLATILRVSQ